MPEESWRLWKALYHKFVSRTSETLRADRITANISYRIPLVDIVMTWIFSCAARNAVSLGSRRFKGKQRFLHGHTTTILLALLDTEDEGKRVSETSRTAYRTTRHHISEERNNQQDCKGNFGYRMSRLFYVKSRVNFTKPASNITVCMVPISVFCLFTATVLG